MIAYYYSMATTGGREKREVCRQCGRPRAKTCICSSLPKVPIALTRCHCVVLQHPLELKRKTRSLPFMQLSIDPSSLTVIVSRTVVDAVNCAPLKPLLESPGTTLPHVWLIFPDPEAIPLSLALQGLTNDPDFSHNTTLCLVFFDATWRLAQEMNRSNRPFFSGVTRVQLDDDDFNQIHPGRFEMRRPPSARHLSTGECMAYCLSKVEGRHPELYDQLLTPMDLAMHQWRTFLQTPKRPPE